MRRPPRAPPLESPKRQSVCSVPGSSQEPQPRGGRACLARVAAELRRLTQRDIDHCPARESPRADRQSPRRDLLSHPNPYTTTSLLAGSCRVSTVVWASAPHAVAVALGRLQEELRHDPDRVLRALD